MYADAFLSRPLQVEETNSLEQRVDALIKKRELMNNRRKSSFNSHCMQNPHEHEQSMQIGPSSYDSDTIKRQKYRRHCQTTCHEYHNAEQIPLYHGGYGKPPSSHNDSSIIENSKVSSVYTCFVCGMDGHLSRFCSQMQCLADHGPDNNMLYAHGPPCFINSYSHEHDIQAVTPHVEKWDRSCTQPYLLNIIG